MYKAKDLRDHSLSELEAMHKETCKKLFHLTNQFKADKKRENPHEMLHARKDIARLLTVITEKKQNPSNR